MNTLTQSLLAKPTPERQKTQRQKIDLQTIALRPIRNRDFNQLSNLYRQSLDDNPEGFVQDVAFHGDIASTAKQILQQGGAVVVAELNGNIVGFGALKPRPDGSVELCKLHVDKNYQGLGIGKRLCQKLFNLAVKLGYSLVTLHVTVTQKAAIALYEKLGFYKTDQQVFHVRVNNQMLAFDTLFMEYPISGSIC